MPDPITMLTIATSVGLFLADKIGGEAAKGAGLALWEKCKQLLQGDPIITLFPEASDSAKIRDKLAEKLEKRVENDSQAKDDLIKLFQALPEETQGNVLTVTGDYNNVVQDVTGSTVTITTSGGKDSVVSKPGTKPNQ